MLIIDPKEFDNLERALKRYKRKFERTGVMRNIRDRKQYTKPSVARRAELLRAEYREKVLRDKYGL